MFNSFLKNRNMKHPMEQTQIKNGMVLLAEPFMMDPNFTSAAILLCEHSEKGTTGFIFNRPLDIQVKELLPDFPDFKAPVFLGGPVQQDTLHFLHRYGDVITDAQEVIPGIYWGGDFGQLHDLVEQHLIQPDSVRFFVGYSGWGEDQLAFELEQRSWIVADMEPDYLFEKEPENLWSEIMYNKGDHFTVLANMDTRGILN